jgi:hypothetical protein
MRFKFSGPIVFFVLVAVVCLAVFISNWSVKWTSVSYVELIDGSELTQSGKTVSDSLSSYSEQRDRGQLQPFLDRYSLYLDDLVAVERKMEDGGFVPIVNSFPPGSAQPAWAAILRSGAIHLSADGKGHVRVYLPVKQTNGSVNAETAYDANYSVVRHPLSWLAMRFPDKPLSVEVFCFNNSYKSSEIKLSLQSFKFEGRAFPSKKKSSLNLSGLAEFMSKSPRIEGAKVDDGALVLAGSTLAKESVSGFPLSIADLAIAYRACFHSGANRPYVSLDPHRSPVKVTVNFGGYLEDTHIGMVLLDADKRFKSLSTGLSPDGVADIVKMAQACAPNFTPEDEHSFSSREVAAGWQGTRFWFYPDSITVETNLTGTLAAIASPRFTADAERSADDMKSLGVDSSKAKSLLAPETRYAILELNQDYDKLAGCFPELAELDSVGRLMGLFVWAKNNYAFSHTDLDELLGVELPAFSTPREKLQLITASHQIVSGGKSGTYSVARYSYTPYLSRSLAAFNFTDAELAKFTEGQQFDLRRSSDGTLRGSDATRPIGELLSTRGQVKSFVGVMSDRGAVSAEKAEIKGRMDLFDARIKQLDSEIDRNKRRLDLLRNSKLYSEYNDLVAEVNRSIDSRSSLVSEFNLLVGQHNAAPQVVRTVRGIGGGIEVRPESFKLSRMQTSANLQRVEAIFISDLAGGPTIISRPVRGDGFSASTKSPTLPPEVTDRKIVAPLKGYYSVSSSGISSDHVYTESDNTFTSVRFEANGRQFASKLSPLPSVGDVTSYRLSRLNGVVFVRPESLNNTVPAK